MRTAWILPLRPIVAPLQRNARICHLFWAPASRPISQPARTKSVEARAWCRQTKRPRCEATSAAPGRAGAHSQVFTQAVSRSRSPGMTVGRHCDLKSLQAVQREQYREIYSQRSMLRAGAGRARPMLAFPQHPAGLSPYSPFQHSSWNAAARRWQPPFARIRRRIGPLVTKLRSVRQGWH